MICRNGMAYCTAMLLAAFTGEQTVIVDVQRCYERLHNGPAYMPDPVQHMQH